MRPGEDATIICTATGDQPIQIQWAKIGQPYLPRSVVSRGGRLDFRRISAEDQGKYTCSARNQIGNSDATAEVVVSSKYLFQISSQLHIENLTVNSRTSFLFFEKYITLNFST